MALAQYMPPFEGSRAQYWTPASSPVLISASWPSWVTLGVTSGALATHAGVFVRSRIRETPGETRA